MSYKIDAPAIIPPSAELTDFDTFASVMTTAPLDDLHKYLDSDDEQDLEDNYEGNSDNESFTPSIYADNEDQHQATNLDDIHDDDANSEDDFNDDGRKYKWYDARYDLDKSRLWPTHAASRYLHEDLQKTIDRTELVLEQLSLKAQATVEEQPMSVQIILANQSVDQIFKGYGRHGSQARFSESVMKFLSGGDTIRRPGKDGLDKSKDGILKFAEVVPNDRSKDDGRDKRERSKRKAEGPLISKTADGRLKIRLTKKRDDIATSVRQQGRPETYSATKAEDSNIFGDRGGHSFQSALEAPLDGPRTLADSLSFRKTSGPIDITQKQEDLEVPDLYLSNAKVFELKSRFRSSSISPSTAGQSPKSNIQDPTPFTPLATAFGQTLNLGSSVLQPTATSLYTPLASTFSEAMHLETPFASNFPSLNQPQRSSRPFYSCSLDPRANAALAREAYNPISLGFSWPATLRRDSRPCMPTPGLLDNINRILHLHNAEARFLLSYYVRKYDTPAELGGRSGSIEDEPPHALFRLGIAQYLMSKVGKMVDNQESDELGLNPEARRVLGEVWERHPSSQAWFDDGLLQKSCGGGGSEEIEDQSDEDMRDADEMGGYEEPARRKRTAKPATKHEFTGGLNPLEKALLARACNISVETVDAYWENMREKTRAWGAMKLWCEAQSRKRITRAKIEGRW